MVSQTIHLDEDFTEVGAKNLDERKRISLGEAVKSLGEEVVRFQIFQSGHGDILLRPVVEIPAREAWLYKNKEALDSVRRGLRQSAEGQTEKLDSSLLAPGE